MRLRPEEWPAPVRGELQMAYWEGAHNSYRRTLRNLSLLVYRGTTAVPQLRISDPEPIDVVGGAMLFRGIELEAREGRIYEHEQVWLVRPLESLDRPPLPPFDPSPWVKANRLAVGDPLARKISPELHATYGKELPR